MTIISKYLVRETVKFIAILLAVVVGLYVAVDFFEKIDSFIGAGLPYWKALAFFLFKTPFIIAQILPVAVLLSVLVVFGLMAKKNEILALQSSGMSIHYLLKPILWVGFVSAGMLFVFSEAVVPITMENANRIWLREVKEEAAVLSKEKNIWLKGNRLITHIKFYNKQKLEIHGVTRYHFNGEFKLSKRTDAERGFFENGKWRLSGVMEQILDKTTGNHAIDFYDEKTEDMDFTPDNLQTVVKKSEEMGMSELYEYVEKIEKEGYDATEYRVDFYGKTAFPFICVIMSIIGTGIAAPGRIRDGIAIGVSYGIGIAFGYWVLFSFCMSLGYGGMLPPPIAAWSANFVFLCFGIFKLINVD